MKKLILLLLVTAGILLLPTKKSEEVHTPEPTLPGVAFTEKTAPSVPSAKTDTDTAIIPASDSTKQSAFAEFKKLNRVILMNDSQREAYKKTLSDPINIEGARRVLKNRTTDLATQITARMDAVEYLGSALGLDQNPQLQLAIKATRDILLDAQDIDPKSKTIVAADQAELFAILAQFHPQVALQIEHEAQGTPVAKVIDFSRGYFGIKKGKEL